MDIDVLSLSIIHVLPLDIYGYIRVSAEMTPDENQSNASGTHAQAHTTRVLRGEEVGREESTKRGGGRVGGKEDEEEKQEEQ